MLLAHISDTHFRSRGEKLYGFIDVNAANADVVSQLNALRERDQIQRIVQAAEDLAGHLILLRAAAVDDIPAHHHRVRALAQRVKLGDVSQLNALRERPDAVVVSGDIVNCGRPEEYQVARQILGSLNYPLYLIALAQRVKLGDHVGVGGIDVDKAVQLLAAAAEMGIGNVR